MRTVLPLLLITGFCNIDGARILAVFPIPSISHQVVFRPIVQELVKRGHELVVITPDPAFPKGQAPANLTEIDVHDISYDTWRRIVERSDGSGKNWSDEMTLILSLVRNIFEEQINSNEVQENLLKKNYHFDLLLAEACVRMTLGLSHVFKVPVIQVSSFGSLIKNYEILGTMSHPILYPNMFRRRIYNLTTWEKVTEVYNEINYSNNLDSSENIENAALKRLFGADMPTLNELYDKVEMLLLNIHPFWENNRPVPPNIIFMGGLHQKSEKVLPEDIQKYLDESKNGVIYVSFGTNVQPSLLPLEKMNILTNVFSTLPYDVLFKWDKIELPGRPENVKISKWLPQADLLRHPKVKLFITQGGMQSTDEAITAGVPLIGIPMLADQWYNVENYIQHKIGLGLNMDTISEEKLEDAIKTILTDSSYRRNINKLRILLNDQPQRPLDRAVWWIEHVLRHGNARHLRSPAANMKWADYLELDLIFILAALSIVTLGLNSLIILSLWKYLTKFISSAKLKEK